MNLHTVRVRRRCTKTSRTHLFSGTLLMAYQFVREQLRPEEVMTLKTGSSSFSLESFPRSFKRRKFM
jgi:hypothetical protein